MLAEEPQAEPLVFDGDWCLIDRDPITGLESWAMIEGTKVRIREVMPVDELLAENAAMQVDNLNRPWGDGQVVARVPMHVWQKCLAPAIVQNDRQFVSRWLNDADHARFSTRAGRV